MKKIRNKRLQLILTDAIEKYGLNDVAVRIGSKASMVSRMRCGERGINPKLRKRIELLPYESIYHAARVAYWLPDVLDAFVEADTCQISALEAPQEVWEALVSAEIDEIVRVIAMVKIMAIRGKPTIPKALRERLGFGESTKLSQ